jgi:hypothetical protein
MDFAPKELWFYGIIFYKKSSTLASFILNSSSI